MKLTNAQLLAYAKTKPPKDKLDIQCSLNWLAAQAATQLSGKEHRMQGWQKFDNFTEELTYTEVSEEYAEWCENYNDHIHHATYTTYEEAIKALEFFVKNEEKQLSCS